MSKYLFSNLIKCERCGKNYKGKMYRQTRVYICSGYSNYGKSFCPTSGKIDEEDLLFLVDQDNIRNIKQIYVDENVHIKIVMNDNSELCWDNTKIVR